MEYEKVEKYVGVYKKEINGVVCYYARFKFRNKLYPFINLSDKYGIRKPREAFEKIQVLKNELRQGINSFNSKLEINEPTIKNLWGNLIERKKLESSPNTIKEYIKFYNKWLKEPLENKRVSEILENDLLSILNKVDPKTGKGLKFGCGVYKSNLKKILSPFFVSALENDYIKKNILNNSSFKFKRTTIKK